MEELQDVTLIINGKMLNARKDLLCEYSDYFRAMFSGNYVENEQQKIAIDVIDADSMVLILRYMELGLIDLTEVSLSTIGDLAIAANFLQITELIKQIEYCLEQQLLLSNWIVIMEIAQNASLAKLEQYSVAYGLFLFKTMKPEYIQTIHRLFWYLSHPYLNTESELQVFMFGLQWIDHTQMGADALLIILCCLDIKRLSSEELKIIKELIKGYVNSLAEKVIDCLYTVSVDFDLSLEAIRENKSVLCELYTEKVYMEVLYLMKEGIQRKLKLTPVVPLCSELSGKPERLPQYLSTFNVENGFQQWFEVVERNLWGWNIAAWGPTKIVSVCGELGRGTGKFMRDVRIYDTLKKEWIQHGVQLPCRRHAGIATVEDSLFIIGGVGGYSKMTCNTCGYYALNVFRMRRHSLAEASESMLKVLYHSLYPTQVSRKNYLCSGCYSHFRRISLNVHSKEPSPGLRHEHASFGCGSSIATSRWFAVPPECPERNIILSWTLPHLVKYLEKVCFACWTTAKGRVVDSYKSPEVTQNAGQYMQGKDMNPVPRPKVKPDLPEIPVPGVPEDPLPGFPDPAFPDVAIPIVPEFPIPELPDFPTPKHPGKIRPKDPLPGRPVPVLPDTCLPGFPVEIFTEHYVPVQYAPDKLLCMNNFGI